jgi:hypothetical protein
VVAGEFEKIVKAGATEYMLVNVSELRDYVMGARLIGDICWNAPAIYATPNAADRYTAWWTREYFGPASAAEVSKSAYDKYFALLDKPDTLWNPMIAIQTLIGSLYTKVGGGTPPAFSADTLAQLQSRAKLLDEALAAEEKAENGLSLAQKRFLSIDVAMGLRIAHHQTHAALKLEEALRAPAAAQMWQSVFEARTWLEQLETEFARGEYPPFDRWYHESWIRSAMSNNNPHRAYNQLRAFIGDEGVGSLPLAPGRGGFGAGPGPGRGAPIPR